MVYFPTDDIEQDLSSNLWSTPVHTHVYYTAKILHDSIMEANWDCSWPPTLSDFDADIVPADLYNFFVMLYALTDQPVIQQSKYVVKLEWDSKIKSICQDIIHCARRKPTPKSSALGLTLRHLTGSSYVNTLLSSLGHGISYDSTVRLETALARRQMHLGSEVPSEFVPGEFAFCVYDNIDFAEETLSGKGTTHHTNGILVQAELTDRPVTVSTPSQSISKRTRTLPTISEPLPAYHVGQRCGPENLYLPDLKQKNHAAVALSNEANRNDTAYLAVKAQLGNTDCSLPSWTGFNIQISGNKYG